MSSKEVDERIVSMKFDNKHFEENVKKSMSTIDRLKNALKFEGVGKAIDSIREKLSKTNGNVMIDTADEITTRFKITEIAIQRIITRLTDRVVDFGTTIGNSFTIEPIYTGFQEYETQINAIQTILSNTRSKGTTLDQVNEALDELNHYADKTIYNFTEMTRNIGTFTAAGVKLDTSVSAIKGIANLAAVSGSTSQQASNAMYQLSQALAAGTVKLMDWNSVVNAGMGGQVFQDALKETARVHGIAIDDMIKKEGSFRETLSKGWLSSEILTETLSKFTGDLTKQQLLSMGYTKKQAAQILALGKDANDAATKVKTFTQLQDTLKEAVQSGWTQTWELIIGDFNQAKKLWTSISQFFEGVINKTSMIRNLTVKGFMSANPFGELTKKLTTMTKTTTITINKLQNLNKVVNQVIAGDYGNGKTRFDKLTKAGYDWAAVQNRVNKQLRVSKRYAENNAKTTKKVVKVTKEQIDILDNLSDKQLKHLGLTEEEIYMYKDLQKTSERTGKSIKELIDATTNRTSGRTLLIKSFDNIKDGLANIVSSAAEAWGAITPPKTLYEKSETVYNVIAKLNKLTENFKKNTIADSDKLGRSFAGLFATLDLLRMLITAPLNLAFKLVNAVLHEFDINLLDVTATTGDAIVEFRNWIKSTDLIDKVISKTAKSIASFIRSIGSLIEKVKQITVVQNTFRNMKTIGNNLIQGLQNGMLEQYNIVPNTIKYITYGMINTIKNILGIHSPSKVFKTIGANCMEGLSLGFKESFGGVDAAMGDVGKKVSNTAGKIDWGAILSTGVGVSSIFSLYNLSKALDNFSGALTGLGSAFKNLTAPISAVSTGIQQLSKAKANEINTKAIRNLVSSLFILVGAVVLLTVFDVNLDNAEKALTVIGVLGAVLIGLALASSEMGKASIEMEKNHINFKAIGSRVFSMAAGILLMAVAVKMMSKLTTEQYNRGIGGIYALMFGVISFIAAYSLLSKKTKGVTNIDAIGTTMKKIGISILLIAAALKLVGTMKNSQLTKAMVFLVLMTGFVAGMTAISKLAGKYIDKVGKCLLEIAGAMVIMVMVMKMAGRLNAEEMTKGTMFAVGVLAFIKILVKITKNSSAEIPKVGALMLSISASMFLLSVAMKLMGTMDVKALAKSLIAVGILGKVMQSLVRTVQESGKDAPKIALVILSMAIAIGILAAVTMMLGMVKLENLVKAVTAISILGAVMSLMMRSAKGLGEAKQTLIGMAIVIAVLATSITVLSQIKPDRLLASTVGLSVALGTLALAIHSSKGIDKKAIGSMYAMIGIIVILSAVIYTLSLLDIDTSLSVASSIGILMTSMAGTMFIISKCGNIGKKSYVSLLSMYLVVVLLGGILALLNDLNPTRAIGSAVALSTLLLTLSASMVIVAAASKIGMGPETVLALGVMVIALGMVGITINLLKNMDPEKSMKIALSLSVLLLSLSASLGILALAGLGGPAALIGVVSLAALIAAIGVLLVTLGGLNDLTNGKVKDFADKGIPLLETIGTGLGKFIGGIVSGFLDAASPLVNFAKHFATFADYMSSGMTVINTVPKSAYKAGSEMAKMILAITAAELVDNISSFIFGETDYSKFKDQVVALGEAMVAFSDTVKGKIKKDSITVAANCGKMLAEMGKSMPTYGPSLMGFLNGETDLEQFGYQLKRFGYAIVEFSDIVSGNKVNKKAIEATATAGNILAAMAEKTPTYGPSLMGFFNGERDLEQFGYQLKQFGWAIVEFSGIVSGNKVNNDAVKAAANAGEIMAKLAEKIPEDDSVWQNIFGGGNGFDSFCENVPKFGDAISEFNSNLGNNINTVKIEAAGNAGLALAKACEKLPDSGYEKLADTKETLKSFGEAIRTFNDEIINTDTSKLASKVNDIKQIISTTSEIAIAGLNNINQSFADTKNNAVNSTNAIVNDTVSNLYDSKYRFLGAGHEVMQNFVQGLKDSVIAVKKAISYVANYAITSLSSHREEFTNAGRFLVEGFIAGMDDTLWKVRLEAEAMANTAKTQAELTLDEHSPSKVFHKIGAFAGQGFVNGLGSYANASGKESSNMAKKAIESIRRAMNSVADVVNDDMVSQPTIRPVLDLSNVSSGVNYMNNMLNRSGGLSLATNVGNLGVYSKNQNGTANDIVYAIKRLSDKVDNLEANSYTINGITYDDGSNIRDAVETLVRASKIGRRI